MEHLFDNVYLFTPDSGQVLLYSDTWYRDPDMTYNCLTCNTKMVMPYRYYRHHALTEQFFGYCNDCRDTARKEGKIIRAGF